MRDVDMNGTDLEKTNEEIKQLMKFEFALLTLIIIAITIAFSIRTNEWTMATKIAAALLTSVTLLVPLIYSWAKKLALSFTNYN
jgi:uncharacterized membrane-anchored protein YitT (DUF2179 family)